MEGGDAEYVLVSLKVLIKSAPARAVNTRWFLTAQLMKGWRKMMYCWLLVCRYCNSLFVLCFFFLNGCASNVEIQRKSCWRHQSAAISKQSCQVWDLARALIKSVHSNGGQKTVGKKITRNLSPVCSIEPLISVGLKLKTWASSERVLKQIAR